MIDLKKTRVLILGGTGTLGRALTKTLTHEFPGCQITILSRDEHKQAEMSREYPKCRYIIGDIRDMTSISRHFTGQDIIFHVAALKHVDRLEANGRECVKTNILGTWNAADAAVSANVKYFVFSSTDKAVDPINNYGCAKKLAENDLFSLNISGNTKTKFSVYRWGNVVGSQGSVIPQFAKSIKTEGVAYITDLAMTRYWLPIDWAVRYMLRTFAEAKPNEAMICPNMKSASVVDVVKVVAKILEATEPKMIPVGTRAGEKLHEVMASQHDPNARRMSSDTAEEYTEDELIEMLSPTVKQAVT